MEDLMDVEVGEMPAGLTLQDKLDRIAHERDVLAVMKDLARYGLREDDAVRHIDGDRVGYLVVNRQAPLPHALVRTTDGKEEPFSPLLWRRR